MIKLKTKDQIIYSAFMICLVDKCDREATKLWSTETNVIDVCETHYTQLEAERYIS